MEYLGRQYFNFPWILDRTMVRNFKGLVSLATDYLSADAM